MNIEQLHDANQEIERLKAKLVTRQEEHDQEIKDIEDVNNAISKLADARINALRELLQLCVNDMYKPSGKISKPTARKLLSACQKGMVNFPD